MKLQMTILLVFLLTGCNTAVEQPDIQAKPVISDMFIKNGVECSMTEAGAIRYRLDNVRVNEIEQLRFIINDESNETAMEYVITDKSYLDEFKHQLETIQFDINSDSADMLSDSQSFAFEVKVKDKEPIVFKGNEYGFCLSEGRCLLLPEKLKLLDFFKQAANNGVEVVPVDLNETSVDFKTWADTAPKELEDTYRDPLFDAESEANLYPNVYNTWYFTDDKWHQALKMAFYINDEFDDYHTINDWNKVVAGLAMQQIQNGYRRNNYGSDLNTYYGPQGDSVSIEMEEDILPFHKLQPDRFVTYSMIEQAGSVLFGNDFVMPDISEKTLAVYPMFTVMHSRNLKLCDIHTPYEVFFATIESGWILSEQVDGSKRTYDLLIYTETMETPDDGKPSHSLSDTFFVYRNDLNEAFDTITGNEEHFKQIQIELEEIEEGIRINSFKYLNKLNVLEEIDIAADSDIIDESPATSTDSDIDPIVDSASSTDNAINIDTTPSDTKEEVSE